MHICIEDVNPENEDQCQLHDPAVNNPLDMDKWNERLRWARETAGFTAAQAAERLKIGYSTYQNYEGGFRGRQSFPKLYGQAAANLFRVSFMWLVTGEGEARPAGERHPAAEIFDQIGAEDQPIALEQLRAFLKRKRP